MLIKESSLRRIIREEARRVLREDTTTVGMDAVQRAIQAQNVAAGSAGVSSPLNSYLANHNFILGVINRATAAMSDSAPAKGAAASNFVKFSKQGSKSPFAAMLAQVRGLNADPFGKARAVLAIFGGYTGNLSDFTSLEPVIGVAPSAAGMGMTSGDAERQKINNALKPDPISFVNKVLEMAAFDVVGETQRALAGNATSTPAAPGAAAPAVPGAPDAEGTPAAAVKKPAMTWDKFVTTVKNGQQIKSAWDRYALASIPAINPNDYSLFKKWWDGYKKANPGWGGSQIETVTALSRAAAARKAQPLPGS